jgi:N-glycosylase/DNA lyase
MENDLIKEINRLKRSVVGKLVSQRMQEFSRKQKSNKDIFSELCFCILTANYSAQGGIRIQRALGTGHETLDEPALAARLRSLGHRFPNIRAKFIYQAREHSGILEGKLHSCNSQDMREWLVKNVLGLGYKEASHFLRNIGITDLAIIDFHIIDLLKKHGMVIEQKSKALTKKRYLEIEQILKKLAEKTKLNLAELDLYLWYMETGKVLK